MAIKKEIQTSTEDKYIIDIERFDREGLSFKFLICDFLYDVRLILKYSLANFDIFPGDIALSLKFFLAATFS